MHSNSILSILVRHIIISTYQPFEDGMTMETMGKIINTSKHSLIWKYTGVVVYNRVYSYYFIL